LLTGPVSFFVRHQAGRCLWAFTHCSVWIVGGDQGFNPDLGSALGEAGLTIRWGIFHSGTSLFAGFTTGIQACVSRGIPGTSLSGLDRIQRNLNGALRHCVLGTTGATAATAIFPLSIERLRPKDRIVNPKPASQLFVKLTPLP